MAIALRAVGARTKADTSSGAYTQSVALPTGHASGDLLLLVVVTDDNTGPTSAPAGWTLLTKAEPGASSAQPYYGSPLTSVYWRMDTGSLGSSVSLTVSSATWPAGNPYVLAWVMAYTGCDPMAPIGEWASSTSDDSNAAHTHPQLTLSRAGDWLLTLRTIGSDNVATFTNSVVGDIERVDDATGMPAAPSAALYDSGAALTTGAQTQRTTTASHTVGYGSVMMSIALQAPTGSGSGTPVTVTASTATARALASGADVATKPGGWDTCTPEGMPVYRLAIDWDGNGTFSDPSALGTTYVSDTFGRSVSGGWGSADTRQAWTTTGGSASDFSVASGTGQHSASSVNANRFSLLPSPAADVDLTTDFALSKTPAGDISYVFLLARYLDGNNYYFVRAQVAPADSKILISLRKRTTADGEIFLTQFTAPPTVAANIPYRLRFRLTGLTLRAKVWDPAGAEPGWQVTATDTTGAHLSDPGSVGVRTLLGPAASNAPVVFSFDTFRASQPLDAEDITPDIISDVTVTYGRDQNRQYNPAATGTAALTLNNTSRKYSPENAASPLFGALNPARVLSAGVDFNGQRYPLFTGRIDDFDVKADFGERTASFTFLDGLADLSGTDISTDVHVSMRTGELIGVILDEAGWSGPRDIDPGATIVRYWWADGTDAWSAISDLVKSEGPPAVAYCAPDGTFTFRDRHHRLLRQQSLVSQATFHAGALGECTTDGVPDGAYSITKPFSYAHGWRDVVNHVGLDVSERGPSPTPEQIWTDESTYSLAAGQSIDLTVSGSDPFVGAITPVAGTDFTYTGTGVPSVLLSRTSGLTARLTVRAVGGTVVLTGLAVRGFPVAARQTTRVSLDDPASASEFGQRTYDEEAPWASTEDARAIAGLVLLHYARRRPTVEIRVVSSDPAHYTQVLARTVGDRIHIVNEEMGLDADFFVERVSHTIQRTGRPGQPPVHAVVLGCEKELVRADNPFTFDKRGAGFDDGTFDLVPADDPAQVLIFDHPVQGRFDTGEFGT